MVFDFHTHIYPDKIAEKAAVNIGAFYTVPMRRDGRLETLLEAGGRGGIDRYLVCSAAQGPAQVARVNDFIADSSATKDNLTGFGTLHPDMENAEAEIARMEALGLKGVKLHPDMQQFYIDDPKMYPIYELLAGRLPVLFHTGDYRYPYSHPERLARVLDDFPALTAIAAHFGGWSIPEIALDCLRGRRCFFDVSSSLMFLGNRRGEELIRLYDPERMLFGSDFPMWDPAEELERFYTLRLSEEERKMILWENALRVLGEKG